MKYAIPVKTNNDDTQLSLKFARSKYFALIDKKTESTEIIENPYAEQLAGAGKSIFDLLVLKKKVSVFIAFELGIKVQQLANENKIQLILINSKEQRLKEITNLIFHPIV